MLFTTYHTSIDTMPIHNYLQVVEHGNNSAMIKKRGLFRSDFITAFENIQRQIVDRFGIAEPYLEQLEIRREIAALELEMAITEDRSLKAFIEREKAELKTLQDRKGTTTDEIKILIEKDLKFYLSLHQITVAEWFGYVKNFAKQQPKKE